MASRREWYFVAGTLLLAVPAWLWRGDPARSGSELDVTLTVVGADAGRLWCALPWAYERYRCEYQDEGVAFRPPPLPAERLQPFVSDDHELYLIPGFFLDPAVAAHVARIPVMERFAARCRLRLLRRADTLKVRFGENPWGESKEPAWIAAPLSCTTK